MSSSYAEGCPSIRTPKMSLTCSSISYLRVFSKTTQNPYSVATVEIQDRQRHRAVAITSIAQESSASTSADLAETQENLTIAETHRQPSASLAEQHLANGTWKLQLKLR
ncbi:unnamed protein product [Acanthoscelides obtectus]|uniref:Uncharacterized protein n=1 Tax=Acanthoscelides obtectus TaxID=200917 RepID=A0A9P0JZ05_ACAOB|nr:unnamed protein product [Acanthoscelides obtectus]CAK1657159.1 hypothetical protein AOBTE_LOCUS20164 [Acanthoscelides obtectus]